MKANKIFYKRLFNVGNYQNEEIGIELEIEEGEKAIDVVQKAKQFISQFDPRNEHERKYNEALNIVKHKENNAYIDVIEAEKTIQEYESSKNINDDLPF